MVTKYIHLMLKHFYNHDCSERAPSKQFPLARVNLKKVFSLKHSIHIHLFITP